MSVFTRIGRRPADHSLRRRLRFEPSHPTFCSQTPTTPEPHHSGMNHPTDPVHLTLKSLETEPIERVQEDGDRVRYTSIRLLAPGIWADSGSQQETYYPPEGVANLQAHYDESEHDGPPLNIMHDIDVDEWEAHEPSIAGHIAPDTLDTDDEGNLYADLVLDTSKGAGQYADENLKSTLESEGTVGFGGPSVEIPAEGLQQSHDDVRDMPRVDGGRLTGAGLVFNPASKSVNFAREAARRPIAMSTGESNPNAKVLTLKPEGMRDKLLAGLADRLLEADAESLRETLDGYGLDVAELSDEEVQSMAEGLHEDLMSDLEGDGEGVEAEDDEDEDPEEEDDDTEMQEDEPGDDEEPDDVDALQEQVTNLSSRLEDLEDAVAQAMTADDVSQELEDAAGNKLADVDSVKTLQEQKAELETRIEELESKGKESKTLADNGDGGEFEPVYDTTPSSESGW